MEGRVEIFHDGQWGMNISEIFELNGQEYLPSL